MDNPLFLSRESVRNSFLDVIIAHKVMETSLYAWVKEAGITMTHYKILLCLVGTQPISKGNLQKTLRLKNQNLHSALEDLFAKKYISQMPDRRDRRVHLLEITPDGEAVFNEIFNRAMPVMQQVFQMAGQQAVQGYKQVMAGFHEL